MWRSPRAIWLVSGAALVGLIAFHLQRRRAAAMGFSQAALVGARGARARGCRICPAVLRVLAVAALAVALARPETYRTVSHEEDSVDIMIVFDMSKSMEETDLPRDRMDAAQRVVRRFLRRTKHDRVGLVIFGQQAMLQCPLTQDTKLVEQIVADLVIGDVPELGTAIGDGLALALAQLRRSDGRVRSDAGRGADVRGGLHVLGGGLLRGQEANKVVILLSDGDSTGSPGSSPTRPRAPREAMKVKVYTRARRPRGERLLRRDVGQPGDAAQHRVADRRRVLPRDRLRVVRPRLPDGAQQARHDQARRASERIPDKQLFVPFAVLAAILLGARAAAVAHAAAEVAVSALWSALTSLSFATPWLAWLALLAPVVVVALHLYDRARRAAR